MQLNKTNTSTGIHIQKECKMGLHALVKDTNESKALIYKQGCFGFDSWQLPAFLSFSILALWIWAAVYNLCKNRLWVCRVYSMSELCSGTAGVYTSIIYQNYSGCQVHTGEIHDGVSHKAIHSQ